MRILQILILVIFPILCQAQNRQSLDSIQDVLEMIFDEDQNSRFILDSLQKKFGPNSTEVKNMWKYVNSLDSAHLAHVTKIIDRFGWLGPVVTSEKANRAIFLVIQHSDLYTQEKYLKTLRTATNSGNAKKQDYAYLLDRIQMFKGKFQVYGTQIGGDYKGNLIIWPIADEPNVNKRRFAVGLDSIETYAKNSGVLYGPARKDSLKNKIVLNGYVSAISGVALDSVEVYTGQGKLIAYSDPDGVFRVIIFKNILKSNLIFKKQGYKTRNYYFKNKTENVFFIDVTLVKSEHD